jgi:hypothetical protein
MHRPSLFGAVMLLLLTTMAAPLLRAQKSEEPKLVLDSTKPMVYIKFDHAGPREPVEDGEPSEGLWLRLVNNSAIPIEVETMDTATKSKLMLLPDVITPIERRIPRSGSNREEMPAGYASGMGVLRTIAPGKDIAFSVPANHVSPNWFMQIPFHFSLPSVSQGDQPICLVRFSWTMIPESDRANLGPHRP